MQNQIKVEAIVEKSTGHFVPWLVSVHFQGQEVSNWKHPDKARDDKHLKSPLVGDSETNDSPRKQQIPESVHLPRIFLLLCEYSQTGRTVFAKSSPGCGKLWDFLRKLAADNSPPEWCEVLFGKLQIHSMFVRPGLKAAEVAAGDNSAIEINQSSFPQRAVEVKVLRRDGQGLSELAPTEALTALKEIVRGSSGTSHESELPNLSFAVNRGKLLQLPGITHAQSVLLGKAVWLAELKMLYDVLKLELIGDLLVTLEETIRENMPAETRDHTSGTSPGGTAPTIYSGRQTILKCGDLDPWRSRLRAVCHGGVAMQLLTAAKNVGFASDMLVNAIDGLWKATQTWPSDIAQWKDWLVATESTKRTAEELMPLLAQQIADCAEYLRQLLTRDRK